jgi:TRAP-type C4-dicarboxylate transport system permease large subunit
MRSTSTNLMIGLLTPPFGVVLFVMVQVGNMSFEEVAPQSRSVVTPAASANWAYCAARGAAWVAPRRIIDLAKPDNFPDSHAI